MGSYLNPGNELFYTAGNSEIYVDKSNLIRYTNQVINTLQKYVCVSRPRRFGKSITAILLLLMNGTVFSENIKAIRKRRKNTWTSFETF